MSSFTSPDTFFRELHARSPNKPPRDYQVEATRCALAALLPGRPVLVHIATGGGKTLVANDIAVAASRTRLRGKRVLIVTKDWELALQFALDLGQRCRLGGEISRLGGDRSAIRFIPEEPRTFVLTTPHTLVGRIKRGAPSIFRELDIGLLIWDEAHWGEHASFAKFFNAAKRAGVSVLGLTATPRSHSRYLQVFSVSFHELVARGYLAKPIRRDPIRTGVAWSPERSQEHGDIAPRSLAELAANSKRNRAIVDSYVRSAKELGKTIVFACNTDHAIVLAKALRDRGIAARPVHHEQPDDERRDALRAFRAGRVQVLVNVQILTHGVDVPDVRSIFLCRPTMSDILFSQMVGRGSRVHAESGKNSFNLVEFTDNLERHGDLLVTSRSFFDGSGPTEARPRTAPYLRVPNPKRHDFDPAGSPIWIPDAPTTPEALKNLWYREGQTFGIEFELTRKDGVPAALDYTWHKVAQALLDALRRALPDFCRVAEGPIHGYAGQGGAKDCTVWNVEYDATAGWEVTSPILRNEQGFREVVDACHALDVAARELDLVVNHRCGTHIHLGWSKRSGAEVRKALKLAKVFEPAVATLVAPSRIVDFTKGVYDRSRPNPYCRPLASVFPAEVLDGTRDLRTILSHASTDQGRYVSFNVRAIEDLGTVEVRLHGGTLEAAKILQWVSLWQQILWAASHREEAPTMPDTRVIDPSGDIVALARTWLPPSEQPQQQAFLARLTKRRDEIVSVWRRSPALRSWAVQAEAW